MHYMSEELVRLRHCELLCEARKQRLAASAGRASGFRPADALRAVFGRI
jgi:hypothetical protein